MRRRAKPVKAKGDTRRPVARTSPNNDAGKRRDLERRMAESLAREKATSKILQEKDRALTEAHAQATESLDQQTATSEILRVISSSPTDARPAFETIVASAGRLCGAESAVVYRFEAGAAHFAAHYNLGPEAVEAYGQYFPRPLHQTDYLWRIADG